MTKEQRKNLTFFGMSILRARDIKRGFMNENWEPSNHQLSAEETERCWNHLAQSFMLNMLDVYGTGWMQSNVGTFYHIWLAFLGTVDDLVAHEGIKTRFNGIENIINNSGIARETWAMFTDAHMDAMKNVLKIL